MAERVGCGTPCLQGSLGVREVVSSRPGRANSKESFSSNQGPVTRSSRMVHLGLRPS